MINLKIKSMLSELAPPNAKLGLNDDGYRYISLINIPDHITTNAAIEVFNTATGTRIIRINKNICDFAQFGIKPLPEPEDDLYIQRIGRGKRITS
jgi:hypothetical protein